MTRLLVAAVLVATVPASAQIADPPVGLDEYPVTDGSTSARPIGRVVFMEMFGVQWERAGQPPVPYGFSPEDHVVMSAPDDVNPDVRRVYEERVEEHHGTHGGYTRLINRTDDTSLIYECRLPSVDERDEMRRLRDANLDCAPIARDAFIFIVNETSQVEGLTLDQVRGIFSGEITNWQEVGGPDLEIKAMNRNRNSGSEETMRHLVTCGRETVGYTEEPGSVMAAPFGILHDDRDGHWISYTFHSYFEHMVGRRRTKALAINGVKPTAETIRSGEYPLCTDVYAVIRTPRNDEDTPARRLRDWLVSDEGQAVIEKTGYISWRQARGEFTGPQFERWGFPMTNGSTSALPPAKVVRAESLKLPWAVRVYASHGLGGIPADAIVPFEPPRRYYRRAMELAGRGDHHGTHTSWERLLETNPAPLTYVCRLPSDDEMRGNSAEEYEAKPVAKDAFVFIMNEEAPIDVLSLDQIRDIFSGRATNWAEVGGPDAVIRPITRNANSGSQETMESLVMRGPTIRSRANEAASMMGPFGELHEDTHAIGYTFWSYHHLMVPDRGVKMLAVDGVYPTHDTIADGSYPLVTDMYAVIRAGSSPRSWDRVLRDWLLTEEGQRVIERSGYVSLRQAEGDGG